MPTNGRAGPMQDGCNVVPALMDFSLTEETDVKQITTQMKKLITPGMFFVAKTSVTNKSHAPLRALASLTVTGLVLTNGVCVEVT